MQEFGRNLDLAFGLHLSVDALFRREVKFVFHPGGVCYAQQIRNLRTYNFLMSVLHVTEPQKYR